MRVVKDKVRDSDKKKKNNILLIFVCIFLSAVIVFGAVFGIIAAVNSKNNVVKFGSLGIDGGEARYLASYFKNNYMIMLSDGGVACYDTPSFWNSKTDEGVSYGELLWQGYKDFLSGMLISIALFESKSSLASSDKERIEEIAKRPLTKYGSVEEFNKVGAKYGFDYDDYRSCVELIYKATAAKSYFMGADGRKVSEADVEEYLGKYSHVSLLFISDELIYEENGNGELESRPLTDSERKEREEIANRLRELIANGNVSAETFEYYYPKSDSDQEMFATGYHLKMGARSTDAFAANYPEVVSKALEMNFGEFAEVECKIGSCFIYKYEKADSEAITKIDPENNPFFSDFYTDAADYAFRKMLSPEVENVEFSEGFDAISILDIPQNYELYISAY